MFDHPTFFKILHWIQTLKAKFWLLWQVCILLILHIFNDVGIERRKPPKQPYDQYVIANVHGWGMKSFETNAF